MEERTPLTMKDIAAHFGISVATVSRALKDSPRISVERRAAIQQYAREHNFTPNMIAESLRHSRIQPMKVIGVIIPEFAHYYFSSILSGIEEEASAHGYRIMVAQSNEQYEREVKICKSFYENKVCGIIVSQAKDTHRYDHFQQLIDTGIPLVFYDRICTGVNASRVVVDDYMGAFNAVSHLIETGCNRIAYYSSAMTLEISKNRYNGYKDALLKHGIQPDPDLVRLCDNRTDAESITPEMLNSSAPPQWLFCCQRRYGNRHPLYGKAHGIPGSRGYFHLWIHQRTARRCLRPYADHCGTTGHESRGRSRRNPDRTCGRHHPPWQDRAKNNKNQINHQGDYQMTYKVNSPYKNKKII